MMSTIYVSVFFAFSCLLIWMVNFKISGVSREVRIGLNVIIALGVAIWIVAGLGLLGDSRSIRI